MKEKYRDKAQKYIEQEKTFEPDWLEFRVWKFTFDEERQWEREEVEKDRALADESSQYLNSNAFYGADNKLYLVMKYEKKLEEERSEYTLKLFCLDDGKWNQLFDVVYQDGEENLFYPVAYYVNSANDFLIAQTDGAIRSYYLATGEQKDISSDFEFDVSNVVFKDGMGYSLNDDKNEVVVFDDETLVEEYLITIPEKPQEGGSSLAVGQDDKLILFNRMGVYESDMKEGEFTKVSSADIFNSVSIDDLVVEEMTAVSKNEFYVSMFDASREGEGLMELKFSRCKGVNADHEE